MTVGLDDRKLAFLDTNVLHYINLWLSTARKGGLYPFPIDRPGTLDDALMKAESVAERGLSESLLKGLRTISFLVDNQIAVQYARISILELIKGRTLGTAILKLANSGVPDRMWGKVTEREVNRLTSIEDLHRIRTEVDGLFSTLSDLGVYDSNRLDGQRDILDLAINIMQVAYMDVADCIIYSAAIDARADYLIVDDGAFKYTINKIHNPSGESSWLSVQQEVISRVVAVRLWDRSSITLPLCLKCNKSNLSITSSN